MGEFFINDFKIKKNGLPFIIAEAGINHNGELAKALLMIKQAKISGANAIKFQMFKTEEFVSDTSLKFTYKSQGKEITESMLEMFQRYEFTREEWFQIRKACDEEKIIFLSTPQNRSDLDLLLELGVSAIKIGSDDFTNIPLLKSYAETKLPILISCGMANLAEVYTALDALDVFNGYPIVLLLCTSSYPTLPCDVNLLKLKTLAAAFPGLILGFSDHTQGVLAASLAVAFAAVVFEKHFTLDRNLPGPDHWFSSDPEELTHWVTSIKTAYSMLGSEVVRPTKLEIEMKKIARRAIVALKDILQGEEFNLQNVGLRRVGEGLEAAMLDKVMGLRASKKILKGSSLKFGDF